VTCLPVSLPGPRRSGLISGSWEGQDHASQKIKIFKGLAKDLPQWLHDVGIIIGTKGTVHGMEETLSTLRGGGTIDAAIWQGKAAISRMNDEMEIRSAEYYMQVMNMIKIHGVKYAAIERDRLLRLVENDAVTVDMHKKLKPRLNVLNQFVATLQDNQEPMSHTKLILSCALHTDRKFKADSQ